MRTLYYETICWFEPGSNMSHWVAVNTPPAHVRDGIAAEDARIARARNAHLIAILTRDLVTPSR
jgi:hypothetical protein